MTVRNLIPQLLAALLLCAPALTAADHFEGMVAYNMSSGEDIAEMVFYVSGNKTKFVIANDENNSVQFVMDFDARKQMTIMDEQKMAMIQPMSEETYKDWMQSGKDAETEYAESLDEADIKKTGRTKTILGYTCHEYEFNDDSGVRGSLWNAEGLGTFVFGNGPKQEARQGRNLEKFRRYLGTDEFFPMLLEFVGDDGESFRMEVTAVKKGGVEASSFEVPAGYNTLDMGADNMLQQMQQMQQQMQDQNR